MAVVEFENVEEFFSAAVPGLNFDMCIISTDVTNLTNKLRINFGLDQDLLF